MGKAVILVLVLFAMKVCDPDIIPNIPDSLPECTWTKDTDVGFYPVALRQPACCDIYSMPFLPQGEKGMSNLADVFWFADAIHSQKAEISWNISAKGCKENSEKGDPVIFTQNDYMDFSHMLGANSIGTSKVVNEVTFSAQTAVLNIMIKDCKNMSTGQTGSLVWERSYSDCNNFWNLNLDVAGSFIPDDFKRNCLIYVGDRYIMF